MGRRATVPPDLARGHRLWCHAAALTLPAGGAIDRYSAAFLHGVDLLPPGAPVGVTVPPAVRMAPHPMRRVTRAVLAPVTSCCAAACR